MKHVLTLTIVILWIGGLAFAKSLSQEDRERAIEYLESTRQGVMDATKGLSADQWNFEPGPDRWSVAEEVEHIAAAEDLLFTMTTQLVMKAPPRPSGDDVKAIDQAVLARVREGSRKVDEPIPTNRFDSPEAAL